MEGNGIHDEEEKWREKESMMKMGKGVNDAVGRSGGERSP